MALTTFSIIVAADFDTQEDEASYRDILKEKAQELVAMGILLSGQRKPKVRFREEHTWDGIKEHDITDDEKER